jgi:hypothetical protein
MSSCVRSGAGCAAALAMLAVVAPNGAAIACSVYVVFLLACFAKFAAVFESTAWKPSHTAQVRARCAMIPKKTILLMAI